MNFDKESKLSFFLVGGGMKGCVWGGGMGVVGVGSGV